jgi:Raf kinase inhibitor-like YbhB/YbcL family protein
MSEFFLISDDFKEGEEIPKKFGYKYGNKKPDIEFGHIPNETKTVALIMNDPDAMAAVGKVWVHWLEYHDVNDITTTISGKTDFGEIGYGGPAPPDKRHTYIFKGYALDMKLDLKEGYSKRELDDVMKGHILAEAKLTGTFTP